MSKKYTKPRIPVAGVIFIVLPCIIIFTILIIFLSNRPDFISEINREFYKAVEFNNVDSAQNLINKGANPNLKLRYKEPPLYLAAKNYDMLSLLIDNGANPNLKWNFYYTPLLMVCRKNEHFKNAKLLIDHGAKIDKIFSENQQTPLYLAVSGGNIKLIKYLIEKGAKLNKKIYGNTVLHYAVNDEEILIILLDAGANPYIKNNQGYRPYDLAPNVEIGNIIKKYMKKS